MLFFVGGMLFLMLAFQPICAQAHAPSSITAEYSYILHVLSVQVSHNVEDNSTHYIEEIDIFRNDDQVFNRTYDSQMSTTGMSDTFTIFLDEGDDLYIIAKCNLGDEATLSWVVGEITSSTDWPSSQIGIASIVIIFVITGIIGCIIIAGIKYS